MTTTSKMKKEIAKTQRAYEKAAMAGNLEQARLILANLEAMEEEYFNASMNLALSSVAQRYA